MSWRSFIVLVRGLSGHSVTAARLSALKRRPKVVEIKEPRAIDHAFNAIFTRKKR